MTWTESHPVFAAGEGPNTFIEELPVNPEVLEPDIQEADSSEMEQAHLQIAVPTPDGPVGHSPHTLMLMRDDVSLVKQIAGDSIFAGELLPDPQLQPLTVIIPTDYCDHNPNFDRIFEIIPLFSSRFSSRANRDIADANMSS